MALQKPILVLSFLLCLHFCSAQQYPFVHYARKDGLVHNHARTMIQDSRGNLYIATFGGLSIYHGTGFTNYTKENGLFTNMINDLVEMGEDSIWIIPNANRIQCLVNGRLKDLITADGFCPVVNQMIHCPDGFYYALADEGLYRFQNNRFIRIETKDSAGRNALQLLVHGVECRNKLYLMTDPTRGDYPGGAYLIVHDLKTGKTLVSKTAQTAYYFAVSPDNEVLVSTAEGLMAIDQEALKQDTLKFMPPPLPYRGTGKYITFIFFDRQKYLWLLTNNGILQIDPQGRSHLFTVKNGLPSTFGFAGIFQDRENSHWFLNAQTGISKLSNPWLQFYPKWDYLSTADLFVDPYSDTLWVMNSHKLERISGNTIQQFSIPRVHENVYRFVKNKNRFYFMSDTSIYTSESPVNNQIRQPQHFYTYPFDPRRQTGISCAAPDTGGRMVFLNHAVSTILPNKKIISFALGYYADRFVITPNNYLWVVTRENKLFYFRLHHDDPEHYFELVKLYQKELPFMTPRAITVDQQGAVWIGTREHGLFRFRFNKEQKLDSWQQFTTKNGLTDNHILSLYTDPAGVIWACTSSGLDRINQNNGSLEIENITRSNGLYQVPSKIGMDKKGIHWALTSEGLFRIEQPPGRQGMKEARIHFTQIITGRDTISNTGERIILPFNKNTIEFDMAAPSFIDEKQTRYSYRLKGSGETDWSEPSSIHSIRLVNLAPGSYTLEAKATFPNGLYRQSNISFPFEILPPWWKTWWFYGLIIVLIVLITAMAVRFYMQKKLEKQKQQLEKKQAIERERTRIAGDMHDDLGAGLSTIRFLGEKIRQNIQPGSVHRDAEKIAASSDNLIQKMNEIIWAMNEKNDSLEDLLAYTRSYAVEFCEEHQLHCQVVMPESIPNCFVSGEMRRNVFLLVKESLHNIVKHANASSATVTFRTGRELCVIIKDNGSGIQQKSNDKLLQGNGIRNMHNRVASMGGQFHLQNENGVLIEISVPLDHTVSPGVT